MNPKPSGKPKPRFYHYWFSGQGVKNSSAAGRMISA